MSEPEQDPTRQYELVDRGGEFSFEISGDRTVIVGRDTSGDGFVNDFTVSRLHAKSVRI